MKRLDDLIEKGFDPNIIKCRDCNVVIKEYIKMGNMKYKLCDKCFANCDLCNRCWKIIKKVNLYYGVCEKCFETCDLCNKCSEIIKKKDLIHGTCVKCINKIIHD